MQLRQPDGKVSHAELSIGDAPIMLADEFPEINFRSPQSIGGTPVNISYVRCASILLLKIFDTRLTYYSSNVSEIGIVPSSVSLDSNLQSLGETLRFWSGVD